MYKINHTEFNIKQQQQQHSNITYVLQYIQKQPHLLQFSYFF